MQLLPQTQCDSSELSTRKAQTINLIVMDKTWVLASWRYCNQAQQRPSQSMSSCSRNVQDNREEQSHTSSGIMEKHLLSSSGMCSINSWKILFGYTLNSSRCTYYAAIKMPVPPIDSLHGYSLAYRGTSFQKLCHLRLCLSGFVATTTAVTPAHVYLCQVNHCASGRTRFIFAG